MELHRSFIWLGMATHAALQIMILCYALPLWRREKRHHWLFFCLSAFISLFSTLIYLVYPFLMLPWSDLEVLFCVLSGASSISAIFAGFAIYWMVQHYRQPKATTDER